MNSKIWRVKTIFKVNLFSEKIQNIGCDPNLSNFREAELNKNLDLGINLDSNVGYNSHKRRMSPIDNRNRNGNLN
jgi:hypothetical protein